MTNPLFIAAVLSLNVVLAEWLVRRTFCRHFGTALLVIVVTAIVANLGIIPTTSTDAPLYNGVFDYVAPLAIFWLLLKVNLRDVLQAGPAMLILFCIGAVGTSLGVIVGMKVVNGAEHIGESYRAIGAMFVGTYTGGSVNFNALALAYDVGRDGILYTGSVAVDNIMTSVWMIATIVLPRLLAPYWPAASGERSSNQRTSAAPLLGIDDDTETVHPIDLGLLFAAGLAAMWLSELAAGWLGARGLNVPSILILTTLALLLAQIPAVNRLTGARLLGMFAVYVFLAVIGAFCDVAALASIGELGTTLLLFVVIVVAVHGLITFGSAAVLRIDRDVAAVASQANIGGGTSALALARSLGRQDLVLPAILVGSLGTGLGTYLGFAVARFVL